MSRGLGQIQRDCLRVIETRNHAGESPDTFAITCDVYAIKPDKHGDRLCNDAQHTAVKRALRTLRAAGRITGQDAGYARGRAHWTIEPAPDEVRAKREADAEMIALIRATWVKPQRSRS
jgi:hypothetical protein